MDEEQTPTEPWVSRSAWTLAPALFFLEALFGLFWATVLSLFIGGLDLVSTIILLTPILGVIGHRVGKKCAMEEPAPRVPRKRLWGTALLLALIYGFFINLLLQEPMLAAFKESPELQQQLSEQLQQTSLSAEEIAALAPEDIMRAVVLLFSIFISTGLFVIHGISLVLGARDVEKAR